MDVYNLIDLIHKVEPESILYCYPANEDESQIFVDEFPQTRIIQLLGYWVPHGTRIAMSEALQKESDVVCLPSENVDILNACLKCLKSKGYLFSDAKIVGRGTELSKGICEDGIFRYKKKS